MTVATFTATRPPADPYTTLLDATHTRAARERMRDTWGAYAHNRRKPGYWQHRLDD